MGFTSHLKTIMQLDDKDWKKSLEQVNQAEKAFYKESKDNISSLSALKDKELMYDHLEKALEKREFLLHMIPSSFSVFYPYRKEARMKEIWAESWIPIYYDTGEL